MKFFSRKNILTISAVFLCLSIGFLLSSCSQSEDKYAEITGFSFEKSGSLLQTVRGTVNQQSKVITVYLPEYAYSDEDIRSSLKPSFSLGSGTSLSTKIEDMDFTASPVKVGVTCSNGNTATYKINILKEAADVKRNSLLFTEYYSGQEASYKGSNNQFIEISNKTSSSIDLSSVVLTRHCWENGERVAQKDQSVNLTGTIPANGFLVIYSQRCSYFASKSDTASVVYQSDRMYNSIITTQGQDGFTLTSGGVLLDCLGPDNGNGTGWNWGVSKHIQRKNGLAFFRKWDEAEWITEVAGDKDSDFSSTAGKATEKLSDEYNDITYFAIENTSVPVYGSIDNTNHTVEVQLNSDMGTVHNITVSTNGSYVYYNGKKVVSGSTAVDFAKPFKLKVYSSGGTSVDYTVTSKVIQYNHSKAPSGTYVYSAELPKDKDVILLYYPEKTLFLGSKAESTGLAGIEDTPDGNEVEYASGMAALCVTKIADNEYGLTFDGKYLVSQEYSSKTAALSLSSSPGNYSVWEFVQKSDGTFNIRSKNSTDGTNVLGIEYYNGFYTYKSSYTPFQMYVKKN